MADNTLTPREAALVEKAKKEAEWKALLKYFIMQEILKAQAIEVARGYAEGVAIGSVLGGMFDYVTAAGIADKLAEKAAGELSTADMVNEIAGMEEGDSPFRDLNKAIHSDSSKVAKNQAIASCLTKATGHMVNQMRLEQIRREAIKAGAAESPSNRLAERQFGRRLRLQMNVIKRIAPEEVFKGLGTQLVEMGLSKNPEMEFNGQMSEKDLRREKLEDVHEVMQSMNTGMTPRFYKAMGGLEQFLASDVQGPKQRDQLAVSLADYVVNDCVPGSRTMNEKGFQTAMYGLKAVLPEKQFASFVDQLNNDPRRRIRLNPEQFNGLPMPEEAGLEKDLAAERVLRPGQPNE